MPAARSGKSEVVSAAGTATQQNDPDLLDLEAFGHGGAAANVSIGSGGHIDERSTHAALRVVVGIRISLVAVGRAAIGHAAGESGPDQRFEGVVHGLEAQVRLLAEKLAIHLRRRRVVVRLAEQLEDGHPRSVTAQQLASGMLLGGGYDGPSY